MDNTGNPVPQLSSLTLGLESVGDDVACHARLSFGKMSIELSPESEFFISWTNATLSLEHDGFNLIEQAYISKLSSSEKKQSHDAKKTKSSYSAEASLGVKPTLKAAVSREVETKQLVSDTRPSSTVVGRSGPFWDFHPERGKKRLNGEYLSYDSPICLFNDAPGQNYQEVRARVHVRQRHMKSAATRLSQNLSRNKEALLDVLFSKGVQKICQEGQAYRGEMVLSNVVVCTVKHTW